MERLAAASRRHFSDTGRVGGESGADERVQLECVNSGVEVVQLAMPQLQEARNRLGETVQLAVLDGVENTLAGFP